MRSWRPVIFAIAIMVTFFIAVVPALSSGAAAKAGLAQAQKAARKWKADAALVSIFAGTSNMDGTADKWAYMFYSPKVKKGYTVQVQNGRIVETLEVRGHIKNPLGDEFIDSPKAMAEAKKNGLKVKGQPVMSLLIMGQATKNPAAYWTVGGGFTSGEVSIRIDAKTGKFFMRHEVK